MRLALTLLLLLLLSAVSHAAAPEIRVRYRSSTTVYLDAGRAAGLTEGQRLKVKAGARDVAEIEVTFLAERSASCRIVSESGTVAPGQRVVPVGALTPPAPTRTTPSPAPGTAPPPAPSPAEPTPSSRSVTPLWGRASGGLSVGYMQFWDRHDDGASTAAPRDLQEYTARMDLSLRDLGGHPLSARLRGWTRGSSRSNTRGLLVTQSSRDDRLHEASVSYEPPAGRVSAHAGRLSGGMPFAIGILDGALASFRATSTLHAGGFLGRASEIGFRDVAPEATRYGAFLRLAPRNGWNEAIVSYVHDGRGNVAALESRLQSGRFRFRERAELETTASRFTNVYLDASYNPTTSTSVSVSYDRQTTLRDAEEPGTLEDVLRETLRQGLRASLDVSPNDGLGFHASGGLGLESGAPSSWNASAGLRHPSVIGAGVGLEGSYFQNQLTRGFFATARAGVDLADRHRVDLVYGRSMSTFRIGGGETRTNQWLRLGGYGAVGRGAFVRLELEYGRGDDLQGPRATAETGYRF